MDRGSVGKRWEGGCPGIADSTRVIVGRRGARGTSSAPGRFPTGLSITVSMYARWMEIIAHADRGLPILMHNLFGGAVDRRAVGYSRGADFALAKL